MPKQATFPPFLKHPVRSFGYGANTQLDNMYIRCDVMFALAPSVRPEVERLFAETREYKGMIRARATLWGIRQPTIAYARGRKAKV